MITRRGDNTNVVRDSRGEVICDWRAKSIVPTASAEETAVEHALPNIHLFLAADLAFLSYTLDKEGGSGHYCSFCRLTKGQWTLAPADQPVAELWTLEALIEMFHDDSKKGTQKLGVKSLPKITHVKVNGYVLPLTHMGLGIDNDTLAAYEDRVEAHIVKVPPDNQVKRARLKDLAREIVVKRVAVKIFLTARTDRSTTNCSSNSVMQESQ